MGGNLLEALAISINSSVFIGTRKLNVLAVKDWEVETLPEPELIISLHAAIEKLQQQTTSTKISVICL